MSRLDETRGPFMDTAAVLKNLDLFITSDTAVAHLAGALGVPIWMPLSTTPDWRWLTRREDNPWYPTMRIFRQTRHMQWTDVFDRIADSLRTLLAANPRPLSLAVETSPGELIDKITILQIKSERITDPEKLPNIQLELANLTAVCDQAIEESSELASLTAELKAVNETLWQVEDEIRSCEQAGDFGPRFVQLARSVYQNNDRRAAIKRRINVVLNARFFEEKSYCPAATSTV